MGIEIGGAFSPNALYQKQAINNILTGKATVRIQQPDEQAQLGVDDIYNRESVSLSISDSARRLYTEVSGVQADRMTEISKSSESNNTNPDSEDIFNGPAATLELSANAYAYAAQTPLLDAQNSLPADSPVSGIEQATNG